MARIEKAPGFDYSFVLSILDNEELREKLIRAAYSVKGYPPWRYVKYHPVKDINPKHLWQALLFTRGLKPLSTLKAVDGKPFKVSFPAILMKLVHDADMMLGFSLQTTQPFRGIDKDMQRTYIQRSLAEEAISSSQMEGAATTRAVAREMIFTSREPKDLSERMILNNYRTMGMLKEWKDREMSLDLLKDIHRQMTEDVLPPEKCGRFRTAADAIDVWDGIKVLHDPPPAGQLERRLQAVVDFANSDDDETSYLHPIIKASILHFMIGYEHPFRDGNGRTARSLFYWYLLRKGYWLMEFLSISALLKQPDWNRRYAEAYLDVEYAGLDLTYFALMQTENLLAAAREFHAYVDERQKGLSKLRTVLNSVYNNRQIDLVDHMSRHPGYAYTVAEHARWHGVTPNTARADLDGLEKGGLLVSIMRGKVRTYFKA